jgi:hypothetical protein
MKRFSKKSLAALGFATAVGAGAATGVVLNATGSAGAATAVVAVTDTTVPSTGSTGTGTDAGTDGPGARMQSALQSLVDSGTLTQAQLDEVVSTLQANRPERGDHGPGGRHGGPGGRGANMQVVADTIGITADQLRTGLEGGQTIAQIAEANGKTAQQVIDALVADATTRITDFVNNTPQRPAKDAAGDDVDGDDAPAPATSDTTVPGA